MRKSILYLFIWIIAIPLLFISILYIDQKYFKSTIWDFLNQWESIESILQEEWYSFVIYIGWFVFPIVLWVIITFFSGPVSKLGEKLFLGEGKNKQQSKSKKNISRVATKEVTKLKHLWGLGFPFIENISSGKFINNENEKSWKPIVTKELHFKNGKQEYEKFKNQLINSHKKIFVLYGKAGAGKSSFLLWCIYKLLTDRKGYWLKKNHPFKKVIFLNPKKHSLWEDELKNENPKKTLLVIDAFKRFGEIDEEVFEEEGESRLDMLTKLAINGFSTINGSFNIVVTIRDDEFKVFKKSSTIDTSIYYKRNITEDIIDFKGMLKSKLKTNEIKSDVPDNRLDNFIEGLITKSEGSPFYVSHLIEDIKNDAEKKNEEAVLTFEVLSKYPNGGMANLMCETIDKGLFRGQDYDSSIPFILYLLMKEDWGFSKQFFDLVIETLSDNANQAKKTLWRFYGGWIEDKGGAKINEKNLNLDLNSHWKTSLKEAIEKTISIDERYENMLESVREVKYNSYNHFKIMVVDALKNKLEDDISEISDAFYCIDLAKLGHQELKYATDEYYLKQLDSPSLDQNYLEYVKLELYELWISQAWKYREEFDKENNEKIIECYEYALSEENLGVEDNKKQFHAYANFLEKFVLPSYEFKSDDYKSCIEKIKYLYEEKAPLDSATFNSQGLFYKKIGNYSKAEECFRKAVVDENNIQALNSFAIFLTELGDSKWYSYREQATKHFKEAEEKFKKALNKVQDLPNEEKKRYEPVLLNTYATFLEEQAQRLEGIKQIEESINYYKKAYYNFEKLWDNYTDNVKGINKCARFLLKKNMLLIDNNLNDTPIIKAKELLTDIIDKKENPDSLHALGVLYYRFWKYKRGHSNGQNWEKAEEILNKAIKISIPKSKQASIVHHERAKLYMAWAYKFKDHHTSEFEKKMNLAEEALENAKDLNENPWAREHLKYIYVTYSIYYKYRENLVKQVEYFNKSIDVEPGVTPLYKYWKLTNKGDFYLFEEKEYESAVTCFEKAVKIGIKGINDVNPQYAFFRLGDCYERLKKINKAVKNYEKSAKYEMTVEGFFYSRNSIVNLMKENKIYEHDPRYNKFIEVRKNLSQKTYKLQKTSKNCLDYGEDLLYSDDPDNAIRVFKEGMEKLRHEEVRDKEKYSFLSRFHELIGHCYKKLCEIDKAANNYKESAKIEDSFIGYANLIEYMYQLKMYDEVIKAFEVLLNKVIPIDENIINWKIVDKFKFLAESYEENNEIIKAILAWQGYAILGYYFPTEEYGALTCGETGNKFKKLSNNEMARLYFLRSIRLNPTAQNYSQLAEISEKQKKWEEGYICADKACELRSDTTDKYYISDQRRLKRCKKNLHDQRESLNHELESNGAITKGIIAEIKGEISQAIEYYLEATNSLLYNDITLLMFLADSLWKLGETDKAKKIYQNEAFKHLDEPLAFSIRIIKKYKNHGRFLGRNAGYRTEPQP